jgi:hypothetical protein
LFIVVIALAINFVGDGLRDAFDPRQKRLPDAKKLLDEASNLNLLKKKLSKLINNQLISRYYEATNS